MLSYGILLLIIKFIYSKAADVEMNTTTTIMLISPIVVEFHQESNFQYLRGLKQKSLTGDEGIALPSFLCDRLSTRKTGNYFGLYSLTCKML